MEVGVRSKGDPQASSFGLLAQGSQVDTDVDGKATPVPQVDQVRRVAQTLVRQRSDVIVHCADVT